ncbi:transcriptional regulator [Deinococcus sp.]|uniref:transcriptional regulator n=1 Tax=Deinococcus sp. TaxID=47478 RepID=UPI003C7A172A
MSLRLVSLRLALSLLALLLTVGVAQAADVQPAAQVVPVPVTMPGGQPVPAGQTATVTDFSTPTDALISALKKSWLQAANGEAVLELVFPPSGTPLRRASALPRLAAVPALIRHNFSVAVSQDTVANRPALRYTLTPTNPQAARWTLWVDGRWNVLLAYQERMPGGALARRAELTSVEPKLTRLASEAAPQTVRPALKKALLSALPGLKLPAGFEPLSVQRRTGAEGNAATEVLLSDGLNVLALVVSPRAVRAASGVAVRRLGGQSVWLVGDLPQSVLEDTLGGVVRLNSQVVESLPGTFGPATASDQ